MRTLLIAVAALGSGVLVTAAAALLATQLTPILTCPPCNKHGYCSLVACVTDVQGHYVVPVLIGLAAAVLTLLLLRRVHRSSTGSPD
jgi:hypothetical protein